MEDVGAMPNDRVWQLFEFAMGKEYALDLVARNRRNSQRELVDFLFDRQVWFLGRIASDIK